MSDYFLPLSRRKTKRDCDTLHKLLSEWSGKDAANQEIIPKLPPTEHIGESVGDAMKSLLPSHISALQEIRSEWENIAGKQLAQYLTPSNIYEGTLFVEVSHPVWLMEFKAEQQQMLLLKIQDSIDSKITKIKLVPTGKNVKPKK